MGYKDFKRSTKSCEELERKHKIITKNYDNNIINHLKMPNVPHCCQRCLNFINNKNKMLICNCTLPYMENSSDIFNESYLTTTTTDISNKDNIFFTTNYSNRLKIKK